MVAGNRAPTTPYRYMLYFTTMRLVSYLDKTTAFFYWLQLVSSWDNTAATDDVTYNYYRLFLPKHPATEPILQEINTILRAHNDPRGLLRDLYAKEFSSSEAQKIVTISATLIPSFGLLWSQQLPSLRKWHSLLQKQDFAALDITCTNIKAFLKSSFDCEQERAIYLLPNASTKNTIGHSISPGNFVLLRPPLQYDNSKFANVLCVVIHEILHSIEFHSTATRRLMKHTYETHIEPYDIPAPKGYTWKTMFIEAITYSFANNITGGYLRPEIFGKSRPTVDEFRERFTKFFARNGIRTSYALAWAGLCATPLIDNTIQNNSCVDQDVFDAIAKEFRNLYLTKNYFN